MKKFILNIIIFSISIFTIYIAISSNIKKTNPINSNDYVLAMIDKHNRINKFDKPKLIFAGGSNLTFGLDTERVEHELSMPTINLGLHAGLGVEFILNELKHMADKNDIIILSIEYFLSLEGDIELKRHIRRGYKMAENFYPLNIKDEISSNIFNTRLRMKLPIKASIETLGQNYKRSSFNKYGDHISHLNHLCVKSKLNDRKELIYSYWKGIEAINEFYDYAKSNNIKVYFLYPCYPESEYFKNEITINKYAKDLNNDLELEILNSPQDFIFTDDMFFDTIYHLNKCGRELRTKKTIDLLKSKIFDNLK
jgi:hypothetical protein